MYVSLQGNIFTSMIQQMDIDPAVKAKLTATAEQIPTITRQATTAVQQSTEAVQQQIRSMTPAQWEAKKRLEATSIEDAKAIDMAAAQAPDLTAAPQPLTQISTSSSGIDKKLLVAGGVGLAALAAVALLMD